jgi:hypothetical protein
VLTKFKGGGVMKKIVLITFLVFMAITGINSNLLAESGIEVIFERKVSSDGTNFQFEFVFDGTPITKTELDSFILEIPGGKSMELINGLQVDGFNIFSEKNTLAQFTTKFPVGTYKANFYPASLGSLECDMTHDFYQTPVVTSPADGATCVPLSPTITWNPMSVEELWVEIADEAGSTVDFKFDLPPNATSFTVPSGLLKQDVEYYFNLNVIKVIDGDSYGGSVIIAEGMTCELLSKRTVSFTTTTGCGC